MNLYDGDDDEKDDDGDDKPTPAAGPTAAAEPADASWHPPMLYNPTDPHGKRALLQNQIQDAAAGALAWSAADYQKEAAKQQALVQSQMDAQAKSDQETRDALYADMQKAGKVKGDLRNAILNYQPTQVDPNAGLNAGDTGAMLLGVLRGDPQALNWAAAAKAHREAQARQDAQAKDKSALDRLSKMYDYADSDYDSAAEDYSGAEDDYTKSSAAALKQRGEYATALMKEGASMGRADMNNDARAQAAYQKTPEGARARALAALDPGDPEFARKAQDIEDNYQAVTGKARIQQELKQQQIDNVTASLHERIRHNKEMEKVPYATIQGAMQRAQLAAAAAMQRTQAQISAADARNVYNKEFEKALYESGYKLPNGWSAETPEMKAQNKKIDAARQYLNDLLKSLVPPDQKVVDKAKEDLNKALEDRAKMENPALRNAGFGGGKKLYPGAPSPLKGTPG